jgi:hypothetical protein
VGSQVSGGQQQFPNGGGVGGVGGVGPEEELLLEYELYELLLEDELYELYELYELLLE